mgnify:CR=1 FL=1
MAGRIFIKKNKKNISVIHSGIFFPLKLILGLFPVLKRSGAFLALFALAPLATGDTVTFTGGIATIANGPPVITDGQAVYGNVVKYQEGDIVVTFLSPGEDWTGQSIGNYYGSGLFEGGDSDDVIHAHWDDISGIEIQRLDDVPFDLQFFHLTSNTENPGSQATGNETVVIQGWLNGIAVTEEFQLPSDDWGGSYQDVILPASFDNVDKVVIRDISQWVNGEYVGGNHSAFCFGMDNFVFDDVVPQELLTGNTVELVVVDSTPPAAPTLNGPTLTKSTTPTLTGAAEPGSTVEISDGVNSLGSVQAESGSYSITVSSESSLLEGSHNITATATDEAGNVSAASLALTVVVDTTAPVITLSGSANTEVQAGSSYIDAGASADGQEDVSSQGEVDTTQLGSYTINYTAQDLAGNVGTATRTVNVVDTTKPVITLNGGGSGGEVTIEVGTPYQEPGAAVSDNYDTGISATIDSSAVNTSVVGDYTVTYNVTDSRGNVAEQVTRTVKVVDTTKPVITLTGGDVTLEVGGSYDDPGATFSDNYDTELTVTINSSAVDASVLGSYDVIYSATDGSGNVADQVTRKVTVVDTTPPVITLNGDAEVTIEVGGSYTEQGATVSDNYYTTGLDVDVTVTPTGAVTTSAEGTYEITYSVTDGSNNTGTATRTVIVDDTMPPTSPGLSGPSLTNSPTPTLTGVAEFGSTVRIYHGANLLGSVGVDVNERYSFQVPSLEDGSYGITATATDGANNVSAASPEITVVVDTVAPTAPTLTGLSLTNSPETLTLTGLAESGSTVQIYDGVNSLGSVQAESGSYSFQVPSLPDGSHDITATATDEAGNVSPETTLAVVVDTTAPAVPTLNLNGPSLTKIPELTLTGIAEVGSTVRIYHGANLLDSVGVDVNGSFSIMTPVQEGSHDITATATDEAGNVSPASEGITVMVDTTAPVITLSGNPLSKMQAGFEYNDAGATADGQELVVTEGEVDTTQLDSYTITYTAKDLAGNVGTATRTVTVVDEVIPVITLSGNPEVTIEVGGSYVEQGTLLSDNYDSASSLGSSDLYVVDSSEVNTEVLGEYLVTYNVTDSQGNVAQQVTRTVKVVDTTSPVITLNGGGSGGEVTIPLGESYTELGATVSDNYDTELAVTIDSSAVDDTSVVGGYLVTYNVTDDSGNKGTATRKVNVVDITLPVVTLNGGDVTIEMGESYTELGATVSDNYYTGLSATPTGTVNTSAVGTYTITYSATDGSQNEGTATRTVTVVDTTAPVVTVRPGGDMVAMGTSWIDAGAISDGGETISVSGSVDINTIGIYTVTYSAFDGFNTGTAKRTVTVRSPNDSFGDVVIYPNNSATLIGQVTIEGEAAESGDIVGVFVDGELRGKQEVIVFEGRAWVNMLVNSAGGNETISFKVFDSSTGVTHEKTKSSAVITPGESVGSPDNPFMIKMKDFETQTLSLKEGWNLVSFYVESDDMSPASVLSPIQNELLQIKNGTGSYDPNVPDVFNSSLPSLNVVDGYWVEVREDVTFEVEGRVSSGVSIDVAEGWNLVGYPRMNGEAVAAELASLEDTVSEIKDLVSSYDPSLPSFLNTLSTLAPGSGYWLDVSQTGTWELGDGGLSFASFKTGFGDLANEEIGPVWGEPVVYPNLGATVLAKVSVQGKPVAAGSVVGVFVGDELRSKQDVVLHEGSSYVTLNVNLNGVEEVSYRVWNSGDKNEYLVSETMLLDLGDRYGNPEPVELNAVELVNKSLEIFNVTSEPFGFSVNTMVGKNYTVEATSDLRTWEAVESFEGSGGEIRYTAPASSGRRQFFRVYIE